MRRSADRRVAYPRHSPGEVTGFRCPEHPVEWPAGTRVTTRLFRPRRRVWYRPYGARRNGRIDDGAMPEHQKTTPSKKSPPIHLGRLISIVRTFQNDKDHEFERIVERRAAWLALKNLKRRRVKLPDIVDRDGRGIATGLELEVDDPRIIAEFGDGRIKTLEVEDKLLELVHQGKMTRADLRKPDDESTFRMFGLYVGQAEEQLLDELASRSGIAIGKPTVWEFVVGEIVQVCEIPIDYDRLWNYALGVRLGGSDAGDDVSRKIAELDNAGFTSLLLGRIWSDYSAQAAEMKLPMPREDSPVSLQAVPKSIEMKGRAKTVEEAIEAEAVDDNGRSLSEILKNAHVNHESFSKSRHFEHARLAWKSLQSMRNERRHWQKPSEESGCDSERDD